MLLFLRLRSGLSQSQLAKRIPSVRPYVSRIENGCIDITLPSLQRYVQALGMSVGEVLELCEWMMDDRRA